MDRLTSDGFVVTAHYRVEAEDAGFTASTYGTVGFTQQPGEVYIPYEQLTEADVTGWVQDSLGKDVVETSLQAQIDIQKAPPTASGTPWSN
jgi:hypothetical protein